MSYTAVGRPLGDVSLVGGLLIPTASGSQDRGPDACSLAATLGFDYAAEPLVLYLMTTNSPAMQNWGAAFNAALEKGLIDLGYAGQPAAVIEKQVVAACSMVSENTWTDPTIDMSCSLLIAANNCQNTMKGLVAKIAAMPKPKAAIKLHFSPWTADYLACVKAKRTWNSKTNKCMLKLQFAKPVTRQGAIVGAPTAPATTSPGAPSSNTWLYVGAAAVALGGVGYFFMKSRRP